MLPILRDSLFSRKSIEHKMMLAELQEFPIETLVAHAVQCVKPELFDAYDAIFEHWEGAILTSGSICMVIRSRAKNLLGSRIPWAQAARATLDDEGHLNWSIIEYKSDMLPAGYAYGKIPPHLSIPLMESPNAAPTDAADEGPKGAIPKDITRWLTHHELGEYAEAFAENAIDDSVLADGLTDDDLKELGVSKLGHRKKILKLISEF